MVKLDSMRALRLYLKDLMASYERETDRYGEKVGRLMRILDKEMNGKELKRLREVDWKRSGMLMVNNSEPGRGTLELLIEAMEDCKAKATRTAEILASIGELETMGVPENASILVYLRHGVPLRVVIDATRSLEIDELVPSLA
ncbi:MAG TPA: hypothetical protein VEI80_00090 [Candidatus Acidoferrales bacterium]|nr:hypothetical protein [Candidatus Acidoferrales bacterium]